MEQQRYVNAKSKRNNFAEKGKRITFERNFVKKFELFQVIVFLCTVEN